MSTEIKGSAFGLSGMFKRVGRIPVVLKPCEHYVVETGTLKHSIVRVHGKQDGSTTLEKTRV